MEDLNFGDCLLKTTGAVLLAEALQDGHQNLKNVNLGYNEIGANGGLSIATAMENKVNINKLTLNGNQVCFCTQYLLNSFYLSFVCLKFGHECCDRITEMLVEIGRIDALDSLDEDDSQGEDEDEEEHYNNDDEDYEGEEDDESYNDDQDYESETEEAGDDSSLFSKLDLVINYICLLSVWI